MADDDLGPDDDVGALRRRLEVVEATLAVQALKAQYGELVDQRFAAGAVVGPEALELVVREIVDLFSEDATWDGGPVLGTATGRAAIAERLRAPTLVFSRHLFVKPRITVELPGASARWDLLCPCRTADGRSWWMCGYEDDTYRCEGGTWRHTSMKLTTLVMAPAHDAFDRVMG